MNAREAAYRSLLRTEEQGRYSNLETDLTLKTKSLSKEDARLYTRLVYGVIEKKLNLDYHLGKMVKTPLEKLDLEVKILLRLGAYQILYCDKIPDSAAVNESVNLMKKSLKSAVSMVNAVLRRLSREKNNLTYPDKEKDPLSYLSVFFSVSKDVTALFLEEFGFSRTVSLFTKMNEVPPVTLRVNTLLNTREELFSTLEKKGLHPEKTECSPVGLHLKGNVSNLPELLEEGLFFVQDEASQMAVKALPLKKGICFFDVCSCPGGKSFSAAMEMENQGEIHSFDLHDNKLSLVRSGAKRLHIDIIETRAADGRVFNPDFAEKADVLLADVPCSGLGVLSKKPDLRYKKEEDMKRLPEIQKAILDNVCKYVKKGGVMGISTCTVLKRENENLVEQFLENHPEFEKLNLQLEGCESNYMKTFYPDVDSCDGFFVATLQKRK